MLSQQCQTKGKKEQATLPPREACNQQGEEAAPMQNPWFTYACVSATPLSGVPLRTLSMHQYCWRTSPA
eukprot:1515116-Amphidinium_carterae.2